MGRPVAPAIALLLLPVLVARAAADGPAGPAETALRDAFKPLKIPATAKLEKEVLPALPPGIVTEAEPFHTLVRRFGAPLAEALARREAALDALKAGVGGAGLEGLRAGWKAVDVEGEELAQRLAEAEERYATVWNLEWSAASEKDRQTRKLAAVLVPLWRGLLLREARLSERAAEALAAAPTPIALPGILALAKEPSPSLRVLGVDAVSRIGSPEALARVKEVLAIDADPAVRLAALDALGRFQPAAGKDAVIAALADPAWEVRALAMAVCARARLLEAVGPLVEALGKEGGRLRQDADDALFALVGVRMYGEAEPWRRWWADHRAEVEDRARREGPREDPVGPAATWDDDVPPAGGAAVGGNGKPPPGTTADFYGISTSSRRIVFAIDVSKSMEEAAGARPSSATGPKDPWAEPKGQTKIAIAKWQLHRAIAALPADAAFAIVVYSESCRVWQPQMTEATAKGKAKAHEFVDSIVVNGTTNVCDALDRAFEIAGLAALPLRTRGPRPPLAADTVFLLSDGDPNRGRVTDLAALLEDLVSRTRRPRIVVHAVGIGEVAGSSFLAALARRTGGQYVGFR